MTECTAVIYELMTDDEFSQYESTSPERRSAIMTKLVELRVQQITEQDMQMHLKAECERKQLAEERKLWEKHVGKRAALGAKTVRETTGWEIPQQSVGDKTTTSTLVPRRTVMGLLVIRTGWACLNVWLNLHKHLGVHGYGPSSQSDRLCRHAWNFHFSHKFSPRTHSPFLLFFVVLKPIGYLIRWKITLKLERARGGVALSRISITS